MNAAHDAAPGPGRRRGRPAAINALGVHSARFDRLEQRVDAGFAEMRAKFDQVDNGFAEMRGRLDQTAAGMQQIVDLLSRPGDQ